MSELAKWINETPERRRFYEQERLVADIAEKILAAAEIDGTPRVEIAQRLGVTKAYVSQFLGGSRNMTLRTLSDFAHALGYRVDVSLTKLSDSAKESHE